MVLVGRVFVIIVVKVDVVFFFKKECWFFVFFMLIVSFCDNFKLFFNLVMLLVCKIFFVIFF